MQIQKRPFHQHGSRRLKLTDFSHQAVRGADNEEKGEEKTLASLCRAAETRMHCQPRR